MRFVLVHGYSGSPADLAPLARALEAIHGAGSVTQVPLHPQWTSGAAPPFETEAFVAAIRTAAASVSGPLAVVGHSTGGTLALLALEGIAPDLLVLAGTPPRVDGSHLARLQAATRPGNRPPDLLETSRMVQAIRAAGRKGLPPGVPVLLLHGMKDSLVPVDDLRHWGPHPNVRTVRIPAAGHDLFSGEALSASLDAILEALEPATVAGPQGLARLRHLEPAVTARAERSPEGLRALLRSPSARRALAPEGLLPDGLGELAPAPVLANVEVTTRCPHACPACARTLHPPERGDLDPGRFPALLARLPHASRITFVGLGEPTLHRSLADFVAHGAADGRSLALVTSGAALTPAMASRLREAGLGTATFSLDAGDAEGAARLRPGVAFSRTFQAMTEGAEAFGPDFTLAVFTAVSTGNARSLDAVADLARTLGARAWMLSDLNFTENRDRSIAGAGTAEDRAAIQASLDRALAAGLPALDVRALEELGKPFRLREFLLRPADRLWTRSGRHTACLSPWQTAAIGADGTLTACDCQPDVTVGNVFETPFMELWNGPVMRQLRLELLQGTPRAACLGCPRL